MAKNVTVYNEAFGSYSFDAPRTINYYPLIIPDSSRIVEKEVHLSGYEYPEDAQKAADAYAKSATWSDFWTVKTDILNSDLGVIGYNGSVSDSVCNLLREGNVTTLKVKNKSVSGDAYPSMGNHTVEWIRIPGTKTSWPFSPNSIRIHTPIYNELIITSPSNNQLIDEGLASGNKIVTLGEDFTVKVELNGPSVYYTPITTNLQKYVKEVFIECGVCGQKISSYTHTCTVPVTCDDNTVYPIKTTVIAKNIWSGGKTAEANINQPDDIYTLTQNGAVYIAGKIYDLEVRTTDDPGWLLTKAEKLSKLPTGENKDNKISAYKYGIKLGYRAYFDLKTLGTASCNIEIKPKIYYITENGTIRDDVTLYYRTSKIEYKKLSDNDIEIIMKMTETKGDVNNTDFKRELILSKLTPQNASINYLDKIKIGGLSNILLTRSNSLVTKYNGKEYIGTQGDISRRWYGEIYLPASTIVVDNNIIPETMAEDEAIKNISRGKGVIDHGYLMITFEKIVSTVASGSEYLDYMILRDSDGNKISPGVPSVLVQEKASKEKIILPNGNEIKNLPSTFKDTDAPIIIYDASLRANDDYETTGTH